VELTERGQTKDQEVSSTEVKDSIRSRDEALATVLLNELRRDRTTKVFRQAKPRISEESAKSGQELRPEDSGPKEITGSGALVCLAAVAWDG
jgi:hypothetical protein